MRPLLDIVFIIVGSLSICVISETLFGKEMFGAFIALLGSMYLGMYTRRILDLYLNDKTTNQEKQSEDN